MFAQVGPEGARERKSARKELRLRKSDEDRIRRAAAAVGLSETDFITEAAMARVEEVERRSLVSVLPQEVFLRFGEAIAAQGRVVSGLAAAAERAGRILADE